MGILTCMHLRCSTSLAAIQLMLTDPAEDELTLNGGSGSHDLCLMIFSAIFRRSRRLHRAVRRSHNRNRSWAAFTNPGKIRAPLSLCANAPAKFFKLLSCNSLPRLHERLKTVALASLQDSRGNLGVLSPEAVQDLAPSDINRISPGGFTALYAAAYANNEPSMSALIARGASMEIPDKEGRTPLATAAQIGRLEAVCLLIKAGANVDTDSSCGTPLSLALYGKHVRIVEALLKAGASPLQTRISGDRSLLSLAIEQKDPASARALLDAEPKLLFMNESVGYTPLHVAAAKGDAACARLLLDRGLSIDTNSGLGTPLFTAACFGNDALLPFLLEAGAVLDKRDSQGRNALMIACQKGQLAAVQLLLKAKSPLNSQTTEGLTALHLAVACKWPAIAKALIEAGAEVDAPATGGATALYRAARDGELDFVKMLVEAGADVLHCTKENFSVVREAAALNHLSVLRYLLDLVPVLLALEDKDGCLPLHVAAMEGHVGIVRELLSRREAKADARSAAGVTPLFYAAQYNRCEVVTMLLAAGAKVDAVDDAGRTPLCVAAGCGALDAVRLLLAANANVNHCGGTPQVQTFTPLWSAARGPHPGVLRVLLVAGADPNKQDWEKTSALHFAAHRGDLQVVEALLEFQAEVDRKALGGYTALFYAAQYGKLAIMRALVAAGATIDVVDDHGRTPLYIACQTGQVEAVRMLLALKANPATEIGGGYSCMYVAAQSGMAEIVELLVAAKADVNALTRDGRCPLHIAASNGFEDVVIALLTARAKWAVPTVWGTPEDMARSAGHKGSVELLALARMRTKL